MPFIDKEGHEVSPRAAIELPPEQFQCVPEPEVPAVQLNFESGVDGQAFSAAALFRSEGYRGLLVGGGEVGLDRLAYGFRVGFDVLWLSDREFELLSQQHLSPFPGHYQYAAGNTLQRIGND